MGWMEFVVALTAHLVSWPVVVLIVAVVFRAPLRELIDRLTAFEGMGQKFSFSNAQRRAEASAEQVLPAGASPETADELKEQEEALRGVEEEPALSIISTWERLTLAIDGLAILLPQEGDRRLPVPAKVRALRKVGVVNDAFVSAVDELRLMRNSVAHGRHRPSPGEAAAYGTTALELERACEVLLMMRSQQGGGDEVL